MYEKFIYKKVKETKFKVAAVNLECGSGPKSDGAFMDTEKIVANICKIVGEAGKQGTRLVCFPELAVSGYPLWPPDLYDPRIEHFMDENPLYKEAFGKDYKPHITFDEYVVHFNNSAIEIPGPETELIGEAARKAGAYVVFGCDERDKEYPSKIYNTGVIISDTGEVIGKHRKIMPVVGEKLYHSLGDARDLKVFETEIGVIGMCQCYEHLQPPLRYAFMAMGEQIHINLWCNLRGLRDNRHIAQIAAQQHAIEGGVWSIITGQYTCIDGKPVPNKYGLIQTWEFVGGSAVIPPWGVPYIAGPLMEKTGVVYADIDLEDSVRTKAHLDSIGKDARPDLLSLNIATGYYSPYRIGEDEQPSASTASVEYEDLKAKIDELGKKIENLEKNKQR